MTWTVPKIQYQIHTQGSNYDWRARYVGSGQPSSILQKAAIDIGINNFNVSDRTVDVYWELGSIPTSSSTSNSHWYNMYRISYTINEATETDNNANNFRLCSLGYVGNISHSGTDPSGNPTLIYRLARAGMFTLHADDDGIFRFNISAYMSFANTANSVIESQTVTLPTDIFYVPPIYVHDGTEFKAGTLYVYDGTQWVLGTPKIYTGSEWS